MYYNGWTKIDILKSMSNFYLTEIFTLDLCPFFKFSNRHPILKSMTISHFLKLTLFTYALTITNKTAIDLIIWKGWRFENTLKLEHDLR